MSIHGSLFRVSTFGESHGVAVGCVCDGVPAGVHLCESDIQPFLDRRKPGQNSLTTKRCESDTVEILSGVENGVTLGTPVAMIVRNNDARKIDYESTDSTPRPGHADFTYQAKYGIRASSGGGRASARETVGRVCAGALASKYLSSMYNIYIVAFVDSVMEISMPEDVLHSFWKNPITFLEVDSISRVTLPDGESVVTRCPHHSTSLQIAHRIAELRDRKDSCGGTVTCVLSNLPIGLGEPVFEKFQANLASAMLSIPAVKGFEIGRGFHASECMTGSQHNDPFVATPIDASQIQPRTNNAGGVLGGITSGENVYFRVAFKPVSSIGVPQETVDFAGNSSVLTLQGRHDPCVLPRAPPIVEAMAAITILDFIQRNNTRIVDS